MQSSIPEISAIGIAVPIKSDFCDKKIPVKNQDIENPNIKLTIEPKVINLRKSEIKIDKLSFCLTK